MGARRMIFRMGIIHELYARCAAFIPLQCDNCEGIPIGPIIMDVTMLRGVGVTALR